MRRLRRKSKARWMRPLGWRECGRTCRPILRIRKAGTSWPADAYPAVPAPTCVRTATASTSRITRWRQAGRGYVPVSYTHLRAHETDSYLVCRLLLEKKKKKKTKIKIREEL